MYNITSTSCERPKEEDENNTGLYLNWLMLLQTVEKKLCQKSLFARLGSLDIIGGDGSETAASQAAQDRSHAPILLLFRPRRAWLAVLMYVCVNELCILIDSQQ